MMILLIGTSILVHDSAAMTKRHDSGNGFSVLTRHANVEVWLHISGQVPEPASWLRQKMVTAPRKEE